MFAATLGNPVNQTTALYFTAYIGVLYAVFAVIYRVVATTPITLRHVALMLATTAIGQATFATLQLLNQSTFGFGVLGETSRFSQAGALPTPLGDILIGVFISGFTGGGGPLATLFVLCLPLIVAFTAAAKPTWQRTIGAAAILICTVILLAVRKETALGALIVAGIAVVAVRFWMQNHRGYSTAMLSPGIIAALPIIPLAANTSMGIRVRQYLAAIAITLKHPLFGVGGANYPFVAANYGLPSMLRGHPFPLHNMYLSLAVGLGLPGIAAFTAVLGLVMWRAFSLTTAHPRSWLYRGVFASAVGFAAIAFWVVFVRFVFVVPFMIFAGAVVADAQTSS